MVLFRYVLITLFIFCVGTLLAQKKFKMKPFHKGRYNSIRVTKNKAKVVCPIFEESKYPYQGIGIKLGDPFAATYKFYPTKKFGLAVDFGSVSSGLYNQFYQDNFNEYTRPDTLGSNQSVSYLSHKVKADWQLEVKLLYHHDATKLLKGLQWYIGGGWQWRGTSIDYEYIVVSSRDENDLDLLNAKRSPMGPVGALGLEYAYFDLPISAFMEVEVFADIIENPGWMRFQGGIGLRVVF